jgi:pimeloyl-ACP methyl ester carboxylesterase
MYQTLKQHMKDNHHVLLPGTLGLFRNARSNQEELLNIDMSLRIDGEDVSVEDLKLPERFKDKNSNLMIFVHGLMADEVCWHKTPDKRRGFGKIFEEDSQHIVLYLRYHSGLHISTNGQKLNAILDDLETRYGDYFDEINLIGHSMGGLVIRSAGHYAKKQKRSWVAKLNSVFLLGVPTHGSFVEHIAHATSYFLSTFFLFHVAWIGKFINLRSDGIKDLRLGYMLDEDWDDSESRQSYTLKRTPVHPLEGVRYHLIAGTVAKTESSFFGDMVGDGMVSKKSALGKSFLMDPDPLHFHEKSTFKVFPSTGHLSIISKQEVFNYIAARL